MPLEQPIAASTIVSQACRFLELAPVSSFGDDSEQAQDLAEQYPVALRHCLEHDDWSFASELVALPEAVLSGADIADPDLPHAYVVPGDCVAIRDVVDGSVRWRLDRRFLRADAAGPLAIRYTAFITDEDQLPASFRTAVAARLAVLLAPRHVSDLNRRARLEADAQLALTSCARKDARAASPLRWDRAEAQGDWPGDWAAEATL